MAMTLQKNKTVHLFDKFSLVIPPKLQHHADGLSGNRVLFIADRLETFSISFEEGMQMLDMRPESQTSEPTVSAQCCENGKYIHQRRTTGREANFAFFHIELEDDDGSTLYLPGQMTAKAGYQWSEGVEPVLMKLLEGINLCKTKGGVCD